ncbi:succinylglutamate desuccinylase [Marinomonas epiphytica]
MIPNNDFLALTLANPEQLDAFDFAFDSGHAYVENTGIMRLEPSQKSEISLIVSVGVHGNETGPIELINRLLSSILEGQVPLKVRLLVLIGNPASALIAKRFCDVNLNRLFSGAWQNYEGPEADRAALLEDSVSRFFNADQGQAGRRFHYDLHTAIRGSKHEKFVVYPYVESKEYSVEQLSFLAACEIDAVLLSHQATTTFSYYSHAHHNAHAFTVELGKVYKFGENDLSKFSAVEESLHSFISKGEIASANPEKLRLFRVKEALIKDSEDYQLHVSDQLENFTPFNKGDLLASSSLSQYCIEQSGDALIFPNAHVPVGQRTGLLVRPVLLKDLALV